LCNFARFFREIEMKVKTNVRAGKQGRNGSDNPPEVETPELPPAPPVSRCVGL
jgi:hypothetical protein